MRTQLPLQASLLWALLLFTATAQALDGLNVGGFADFSIVQRVGAVGTLTCSGVAPVGSGALEAQVLSDDGATAITTWTPLATPGSDGAWRGTITAVPQGGWYRVQVRPVSQPSVTPSLSSARCGVGAVVICIGQSNMVRMFEAVAAPAASDARTRLRGYHGAAAGSGTGDRGDGPVLGNGAIRLANQLRQELKVPVLLLDYAVPGKSIVTWTTTTDPVWTTCTAGLATAGGDAEMVLWHQGATDAVNGVSEAWHRSRLDLLYANLKALLPARSALPFVCTVQNRGDYQPKPAVADNGYDHVRRAQWLWSTTTPGAVPGGSTIDMTLIDVGHWPPADYEILADRLAQSALSVLQPARFPLHAGGAVLSSALHSGRRILVGVRHAGGRALHGRSADTGIDGFLVDRGVGTAALSLSSAQIIGSDTVELTLASNPGAGVRVRYLVGMNPFAGRAPGNLLYDDTPYVGGRVGLPVNGEPGGITATEPLRRVGVDLGPSSRLSTGGWNNLAWPATALSALITADGSATPFALTVTDAFLDQNSAGATTAVDELPVTATGDSFYGGENFAGKNEPTAGVRLSGLDPAKRYVLSCFGARAGVSDRRQTQYTGRGAGTAVRLLECANNTSALAVLPPLVPTAAGALDLLVQKGPDNTNANGFYYLGAFTLDEYAGVTVPPPATATRRLLIDLGDRLSPAPWNNLTWPGTTALALRDDTGAATPISLVVTDAFLDRHALGVDASAGEIPSTALNDAFMGGVNFNGKNEPTAGLRLTGLDPTATYTLSFGASRAGVSDNRETRYTLTGGAPAPSVRLLQTANNTGSLAVFDAVRSSSTGTIDIGVDKGPANTNAYGFYYLGVIVIQEQRAPPAGSG